MKRYGELLRIPGLAAIVTAQLLARFPGGMLALGLLIHVQSQTGNFTIPGFVLAAQSLGQAVASPIMTRLMIRFGIRRVIGSLLVISVIAITVMALVPLEPLALVLLGLVIGFTLPPIQPAARAVYPSFVKGKQLLALQALDASVQELIWILGPVIVVFLATQVDTHIGVLASAGFAAFGGLWFLSRPAVGTVQLEQSTGRMGAVLRIPAVAIVVISGLLVVGSFAALEASVVSAFGSEKDSPAGIILALWAVASLIGGLAMGHTPIAPWSLARRLSIVAVGTALAMFTVDPILLTLALLIAGVAVAPSMTVQYAVATESVDKGDMPESLGWLGTGWVIGAAISSAIAGITIDAFGTIGGFAIATIFGILAVAVPALGVRKIPDLRHLSS